MPPDEGKKLLQGSASATVVPHHQSDLPDIPAVWTTHNVPWFDGIARSPLEIDNWDFFDGAVAAVAVLGSPTVFLGSAAIVAPGLAVTARHVLDDSHVDLVKGTDSAVLLAPRRDGEMDVWEVTGTTRTENDVALLTTRLRSGCKTSWRFNAVPLSLQVPDEGNQLFVLGFSARGDANSKSVNLRGELYASAGLVVEIRPTGFWGWRTVEVGCGALSGNSGGPVLDVNGALVGVVSSSLEVDDGNGPTQVSLLFDTQDEAVPLGWPSCLEDGTTTLRRLKENLPFSQYPD